MAFVPKLARALQGFGAGVAGKGQEFIENLDDDRKQAMLEDALTVQQQLQTGDISGARSVLLNRLQAIDKLGGNPADTEALLLKLDNGDIAGAFNDVSGAVNAGVLTKRLAAPGGGQQDKLERVGSQVVNLNQGTSTPIQGFTQPVEPANFGTPFSGLNEQGQPTLFRARKTGGTVDTGISPLPSEARAEESAREREIQDFMATLTKPDGSPISRQQAIKLQKGFRKIVTDTQGQQTLTDVVDETTVPITRAEPDLTSVRTPQGQTLFTAAKEGTGLYNSVARAIARVGAPVGLDIKFAEEEFKAEQILNSSQRDLVLSYTKSKNYSIREFELVNKLFDLMPSPFKQPEEFLQQAKAIEGLVVRSIAQAETDIRSSTISRAAKEDAQRIIRDSRKYIDTLGVPLNEKEDVRSWVQSRKGFFDLPIQDQESAIRVYQERAGL